MSRMTTSRPSALRAARCPSRDGLDRVGALVARRPARSTCSPSCSSWSIAAGRWRSAATSAGLAAVLARAAARACRRRSSCPSPAGRRAGSPSAAAGENASRESPEPISSVSSSWTIFTTCWPGVRLFGTSCAERALAHVRDELLDDVEVDVGLEQREADLAHRARDRLLVERRRARGGRRGRSGACLKACRTRLASVAARVFG